MPGPVFGPAFSTIPGSLVPLALVITSAAINAAADAQTVARVWDRRYPEGPGAESADRAMAAGLAGGHLYVLGQRQPTLTATVFEVVKYDMQGVLVAAAAFPRTLPKGQHIPRAMVVVDGAPGARVYVTGDAPGTNGTCDMLTVAFDQDLNLLWANRYHHAPSPGFAGDDRPFAIAADHDHVAVTGISFSGPGNADYATVLYRASDGAPASAATALRYDGGGADKAVGIALRAGTVYITGHSWAGPEHFDIVTFAHEIATGHVVPGWPRVFRSAPSFADEAVGIAVSAAGAIYVAGQSVGAGAQGSIWDFALLRYSPNGVLDWHDVHADPMPNMPRALACARRRTAGKAEDYVYVAGDTGPAPLGAPKAFTTIQYRDLGAAFHKDWAAITDEPSGLRGFVRAIVGIDGDEGSPAGVLVAGWAAEPGANAKIIKYTCDGPGSVEKRPVWTATFDGPAGLLDAAWAVAHAMINGGLNVFAVGASEAPASGSDFLVLRLEEQVPAGARVVHIQPPPTQ